VILVLLSCRKPRPDPGAAHPAGLAPSPAPITLEDLAAYRTGLAREASLVRREVEADPPGGEDAPLQRSLLDEGAAAAGIAPGRYRALVGRMDSLLRSRSSHRDDLVRPTAFASPAVDTAFGRMAPELDSARVELIVLRLRLAGLGRPRD
jgi:hypothetical protein